MNDALTPSGSEQPYRGPSIEQLLPLLEEAPEGSASLDFLVAAGTQTDILVPIPQYTRSLDAALTLVPKDARLRELGQWWNIDKPGGWYCNVMRWEWTDGVFGAGLTERSYTFGFAENDFAKMPKTAPSAALALCIAALKANATAPKSVPSVEQTQDRGASPKESLPESNNQSETP